MTNRKIAKEFLNLTVASVSTEASSFAKENVLDRTSPQKHWRSTAVTQQEVVIDLGSDKTSITVYMDWVNFNTVQYQEGPSSSGPWTTLQLNGSDDRTIEKDPMHGVYRRRDELTLTTKRYLRALIPAQTPVDGAAYFRIGTLAIPDNITELDAETTVEYPFEVTLPETYIVENRFPGGKTEKIKLGQLQPMVISFALRTEALQNLKGTQIAEIADLLRDTTGIIYLDFNLGETWQAYLVKKAGDLRATLSAPAVGTADFGTVLFEVVV
jgi:hypothetical protein